MGSLVSHIFNESEKAKLERKLRETEKKLEGKKVSFDQLVLCSGSTSGLLYL